MKGIGSLSFTTHCSYCELLLTYIGTYAFSYVSNSVVRDLRQRGLFEYAKLNMTYFDTTPAGAIVSRLTNDTQAVSDMFSLDFLNVFKYFIYRRWQHLSAMFEYECRALRF